MHIYRLTPTGEISECWKTSTHKSAAVVRAPSEKRARLLASRAFGIAVKRGPAGSVLTSPWTQEALALCEVAIDTIYPADGPEEVLEPK